MISTAFTVLNAIIRRTRNIAAIFSLWLPDFQYLYMATAAFMFRLTIAIMPQTLMATVFSHHL